MNKENLNSKQLLWVLALIVTMGCKDQQYKEAANTTEAANTSNGIDTSYEVLTDGNTYFFGSRSPVPEREEAVYNYEFVEMTSEANDKVSGWWIYAPYGTDGFKGSFAGVYDKQAGLVRIQLDLLAEGERYTQARDLSLSGSGLTEVGANRNLRQLDKEGFEEMVGEFRQQQLQHTVNRIDRSRLKKVTELRELFDADKLEQLKFYEVYTDLDHNPSTAEYLLYVMDPMYCGSGGCNLMVIDDDGKLLQNMTVTDLPIYTTRSSIEEEQQHKGQWRDLYVWSQGMRRVAATDGGYPSNPSVQPKTSLDELKRYPDQYRLLLDYLD